MVGRPFGGKGVHLYTPGVQPKMWVTISPLWGRGGSPVTAFPRAVAAQVRRPPGGTALRFHACAESRIVAGRVPVSSTGPAFAFSIPIGYPIQDKGFAGMDVLRET